MQEKFKKLLDSLLLKLTPSKTDIAHDGTHVQRVINMAILIAEKEHADLEVVIPAAVFHDAVTFRKDDERNKYAPEKSAEFAKAVLQDEKEYPRHKIHHVMLCITECSYSRGIAPSTLESKILQDADRLEATGAIAIMRTFSSGGQMERPFYNPEDPFREDSSPSGTDFSLDLLYKRLFLVCDGMHTATAKSIALRGQEFLKMFEDELRIELGETGVWKQPPSNESKRSEWYQRRHGWM